MEYLENNPHDPLEEDMPLHEPIPKIPKVPKENPTIPEKPPKSQGNLQNEKEKENESDQDYIFKCQVIKMVQMHPLLYDTAHPSYHKDQQRDNAWDDIAMAVDIDVHNPEESKFFLLVLIKIGMVYKVAKVIYKVALI